MDARRVDAARNGPADDPAEVSAWAGVSRITANVAAPGSGCGEPLA
jgi:hypothetical protein